MAIRDVILAHRRAAAAGGVAILALAGGGIAYAVAGSGSTSHPTISASTSTVPSSLGGVTPSTVVPDNAGGQSGPAVAKHRTLKGTVTAISGNTWTVTKASGKTVTVTVTAATVFGTPKAPEAAQSFPVGSTVAVTGTGEGTTITATRIHSPKAATPAGV